MEQVVAKSNVGTRLSIALPCHAPPSTSLHSIGRHDPPLCSNCDLNLDTRLDVDDDLLNHLGRRIQIDQSLVNSHLEHIPGLRTLTAGCLSGGNLESLGRQADRAFDAEVLRLRTLEELGTHFLEGSNFAARQGDADLVDFL
jgi:hypothetical protein